MLDDFERELKVTFLDEATQLLSDSEQCFLEIETAPQNPELIEKIFRLAHNLKGSANAVGFQDLGSFTHQLESFLLRIKSGELSVRKPVVDLLLRCNDQVVMMVAGLKRDPSARFDSTRLIQEMREQMVAKNPEAGPESVANPAPFQVFEATQAPPALKIAPAASSDESIRVNLQRVDKLINFIGELVILQTVLKEQSLGSLSPLVRKTVHQLGKVTKEVQDLSMGLRMVPLKPTFQKMQRIVRDTSAALNKKVQLVLEGEDTEVDKTILERLGDPLVHLVRNAIDHGIEDPATRAGRGKPEQGTVRLRASVQGGSLVIEVIDDGAGLDPERLKAKAIEKGLLSPSSNLSDREAYQLIFSAGFSTKSTVTDVSGRGVGMDVVKTNIEQLQGDIQIETELGAGTRLLIRLPLTLSIIDGMVVQCHAGRYVIPLVHVHESTRVSDQDVHTVSGLGEVYTLRGETFSLYRLAHLLGKPLRKAASDSEGIAIIVRAAEKPFAIVVDEIIGQHQVVVKKLGLEHAHIRGFSGSAIMGDGRTTLILELPDLIAPLDTYQARKGAA